MEKEMKRKEKTNYGVAFITVTSNEEALKLIEDMKEIKKFIKEEQTHLYESLEVYVSFSPSIHFRIGP